MSARYDAIIIGAGIIGACTAFEFAKRGWRTLNIDKLPAAGYGSTGSSCAIIRTHYSTLDGAALAYEGYFRWDDWSGYLETADERGLARFHQTGCLVMKTAENDFLRPICGNMDKLGIPWEDWSPERIDARLPFYNLHSFGPPKPSDDPDFAVPAEGPRLGGVFFPRAGYIGDPQLASHNAQRAAEAKGALFRFNSEMVEIRQADDRIAGVTLASGETIDAPVVVNIAGPHSAKVNRQAGVKDMKIGTRALKQEVAHVPFLKEFDFGAKGMVTSDGDIGCYCRPEVGNHIVIGTENPPCDLGSHLLANSSNPISTNPGGRCGHGYIVCHKRAPENVACAFNPSLLEAVPAFLTVCIAHSVRAFGLFFTSSGAKLSNIRS
jgi:sarcosine oxidase subunit beta